MLQVSADWGNMAAARTGGRTARRQAGSNFSRRRGRTCQHGRAAASGSPPALLPVSTRSLSLRRALFLPRNPSLSVFPAVSNPSHAFSRRPEQRPPVRRVVCCGVPRGAPWRLSDDKATP